MFQRIFIAVLSMLVAYAAVYFGNGLHEVWIVSNSGSNDRFLIFVTGLIVAVLGMILWGVTVFEVVENIETSTTNIYVAAVAFILISAIFGLLAQPFTFGPYPWQWVSMWDIVVVLAPIPVLLEITRRNKS